MEHSTIKFALVFVWCRD